VGFILTTKSGAIEGEEFVFGDGSEARIGRTHGNDVVVHDNEASRNHARIFETDEGCFIEDLGSANGTFVNGEGLEAQEPVLLNPGDVIAVGSGELVFWDQSAEGAAGAEPSEESTVIKSIEEVESVRQPPAALAVASRAPRQPVRKAPSAKPAPLAPSAKAPSAKASIAKRGKPPAASLPVSAAERARKQREAQKSFFGKLRYAFVALEPQKRRVVVISLVLTAVVVLGGMAYLIHKESQDNGGGPQPRELVVGRPPLEDSFGWGREVDWPNVDGKEFRVHMVAPGRMVAVVRYYATDISSEEVDILFNNVSLGFIPADTLVEQENELVVPPRVIRNGEYNTLLFDNVHNPPRRETWRIWGLAVDIEPVPNFTSSEEAQIAIAAAMQAAQQSYDARKIAPANLYESWRAYRRAWLFTESLEEKNERDYEYVLSKYRETRRELDELCAKYILDVRTIFNTSRSYERIIRILEDVLLHFPRPDHPCHREAQSFLKRT